MRSDNFYFKKKDIPTTICTRTAANIPLFYGSVNGQELAARRVAMDGFAPVVGRHLHLPPVQASLDAVE